MSYPLKIAADFELECERRLGIKSGDSSIDRQMRKIKATLDQVIPTKESIQVSLERRAGVRSGDIVSTRNLREGSFEELRDQVQGELEKVYDKPKIVYLFNNSAHIKTGNGKMYDVPFTIGSDGKITLSAKKEIKIKESAGKKPLSAAAQKIQQELVERTGQIKDDAN